MNGDGEVLPLKVAFNFRPTSGLERSCPRPKQIRQLAKSFRQKQPVGK